MKKIIRLISLWISKVHLPIAIVLSVLVHTICPLEADAQFKEYNLRISSEEMQEFFGLGFSIHNAKTYFLPANASVRQKLYTETFSGFNTISFWSYIENPSTRDLVVAEAKKYGLKRIIVNPTGYPLTPLEHANQQFKDLKEYLIAGYPVYGTTIMNKSNTDESDTHRQTPEFLAECAKLLKAKLDSAGFTEILIGGPSTIEWSPYIDPTLHGAAHGYGFQPGDNMMYLNGMIADQDALNVMSAFDFQSYGWSITEEIQTIAGLHKKELWVSLSATDGENNNNGDPILGPISASNLLANINHGVKHWNYWVWDQLANFSTGELNKRGKVLQQLGKNFKEGAVVRKCLSDPYKSTSQMFWNYYDVNNPAQNKQPELVAAAAKNKDNSFVIGMVNLTGIHAQHFYSKYFVNEAAIINANITIDEMKPNAVGLFQIQRTKTDGSTTQSGTAFMKKNALKLSVASTELVILKAESIFESSEVLLEENAPAITSIIVNENLEVELVWTDNSPNETGFVVERRLIDGGTFSVIANLDANEATYTDISALTENATYEYKVTAVSTIHVGELSFPDDISSLPASITIGFTGEKGIKISEADIKLFPNPSHGVIRFQSDAFNELCRMDIYDLTGALLMNRMVNMNQDIDISSLGNGIYNLRIGNEKGFITKKIILIH
jgi:hypothetical protein